MKFAGIHNFVGCFSKDKLPSKIVNDSSYIVNLENEDDGNGTHWTCIYSADSNFNRHQYYDSYGIAPPKEVIKFMKSSNNKNCVYSSNTTQNYKSILCGYYCINYIIQRYYGVEPYDIIYQFENKNNKTNDKLVMNNLKLFLAL